MAGLVIEVIHIYKFPGPSQTGPVNLVASITSRIVFRNDILTISTPYFVDYLE